MADLTLEQRRALALARARRRRAEATGNPPPAGMTATQAAERDLMASQGRANTPQAQAQRAYEAAPVAAGVASAVKGVPFVGEYADEATGVLFGAEARDRQRLATQGFEAANPALATGAQIATGVGASLPLAVAAAPAVAARAGTSLAGNVLRGVGAGVTAGATEGAVAGAGRADGGNRLTGALQGAAVGGALGGVLGAAVPVVSRGVANVVRNVRGRPDASAARAMGASPESAEAVGRMLEADDPFFAINRIRSGGKGAMVADAGEATAGLLDTAIQRAGGGAGTARRAVEERAAGATRSMQQALDDALAPVGRSTSTDIIPYGMKPSQIRQRFYDAAYAKPIDYASESGRELESLFPRIPQSAVRAANELMRTEGVTSKQILADVAEDGSVTFREMPDVRQLDYITRGLNQVADEADGKGKLGGTTPVGRAYGNLSREIRTILKEAIPEYKRALNQAATEIGIKQAREIGEAALRPGTTRGDLAEQIADMGKAELGKVREGVRSYIDDVMSRVRRTAGNPNTEASEGLKALKELSDRGTKQKLRMILGEGPANALISRMSEAGRAFELRAAVATNSRTFGRQSMDQALRQMSEPGIVAELLSGSPMASARKLVQSMTNMTPEARQQVERQFTGEIVNLLTGARGQDAVRRAEQLLTMLERQPQTEALARRIGQAVGASVAVGGYQSGAQSAR